VQQLHVCCAPSTSLSRQSQAGYRYSSSAVLQRNTNQWIPSKVRLLVRSLVGAWDHSQANHAGAMQSRCSDASVGKNAKAEMEMQLLRMGGDAAPAWLSSGCWGAARGPERHLVLTSSGSSSSSSSTHTGCPPQPRQGRAALPVKHVSQRQEGEVHVSVVHGHAVRLQKAAQRQRGCHHSAVGQHHTLSSARVRRWCGAGTGSGQHQAGGCCALSEASCSSQPLPRYCLLRRVPQSHKGVWGSRLGGRWRGGGGCKAGGLCQGAGMVGCRDGCV